MSAKHHLVPGRSPRYVPLTVLAVMLLTSATHAADRAETASLTRVAQASGSVGTREHLPGTQTVFHGGHGHFVIDGRTRDFAIRTCTVRRTTDGSLSFSLVARERDLRLTLSSSTAGNVMTIQVATVMVGKLPNFVVYRTSRFRKFGKWIDAKSQPADGPLLVRSGNMVRMKATMLKSNVRGDQGHAQGQIVASCGKG